MNTYLITGATGVLGSAIAEHLLRSTDSRLVLVIRAKSPAELEERRRGILEYCDVSDGDSASRVVAVAGDTSLPALGVDAASYQAHLSEITHVVHSAGAVRMNLPIEKARASAVDSCRNILRLCEDVSTRQGRAPKLEFVSTVGVGGRMRGTVPERWIRETREFHNTYEQSKAEAEVLLEEASSRAIPLTVHRPSMVVGDSRTGKVIHFQVFYHLMEFLTGARTFGFLPDPGDTLLDLVPSDFVAKAIVRSSVEATSVGRVLHLAAGAGGGIDIATLQNVVADRYRSEGKKIPKTRVVPVWVFRALIPLVSAVSNERTRRALSTLPVFLDYLDSNQRFGNELTGKLLAEWGMTMPNSRSMLDAVIDFYFASRRHRG